MGIVLLTSIILTTVVYSAFNVELQINGDAYLRVNEEIRITDLKFKSRLGSASEEYSSRYGKDTTSIYVTLPRNSSVTYEAVVTNNANYEYGVSSIDISNSNDNVSYSFNNMNEAKIINRKTKETFSITLTNNTSTIQFVSFSVTYKFEVCNFYTITYDLDGGTLLKNNPSTYTNLSETFTLNEPTREGYKFLGWEDQQDKLFFAGYTTSRIGNGYDIQLYSNIIDIQQSIEGNKISYLRINLSTFDGTYLTTISTHYIPGGHYDKDYVFPYDTGMYKMAFNANTNKADGGIFLYAYFEKDAKYKFEWNMVVGNENQIKFEDVRIYKLGGSTVGIPIGTITKGSTGNRSFKAIWEKI